MSLTISRDALAQIRNEAAAAAPAECCGILLGSRKGNSVLAVMPARNVAAQPERCFEIDPVVLLAAHRSARQGGPAVLGHYHSHPTGRAEPSATDAAMAQGAGEFWIIVGEDGRTGAWQAVRESGPAAVFHPVELVVAG